MATRQSGEWPGESSAKRALYRKVCIVTDSASDILPRHAQALGIVVVPNRVVMDGRRLRDGIDITASEFYARLPRTRAAPYTEPASAKDLYVTYQAIFNLGATAIISAHVSSRLSQLVTHAQAVRDYLAPAPIYVLDTQQAGIGMWPAVTSGARLANRGASAQEIYTRMVSTLAQTRLYFLVESLEHLRRSGRVGRIQEFLGALLDAHPILTIEQGEVRPVESVRPRARAALRMRELALARPNIETLLLCGTSIEAIAQMENLLSEQYDGLIQKTWLGPTLGANTGPAVAIAVVAR